MRLLDIGTLLGLGISGMMYLVAMVKRFQPAMRDTLLTSATFFLFIAIVRALSTNGILTVPTARIVTGVISAVYFAALVNGILIVPLLRRWFAMRAAKHLA